MTKDFIILHYILKKLYLSLVVPLMKCILYMSFWSEKLKLIYQKSAHMLLKTVKLQQAVRQYSNRSPEFGMLAGSRA
jgi:hypothetical protein